MSNTAILYISLWLDCPTCGESLDLFDEKDCWETGNMDDGSLAFDLVQGWLKNQDIDEVVKGTCTKCGKEFTVDHIEY